MDLKILVAVHKPSNLPRKDVLVPIQVGAALHTHLPGMLRDDIGTSISRKNPYYCELTALYWGWKNLDAEYIGLCHYRRYFASYVVKVNKLSRIADEKILGDALKKANVLLPQKRRYFIETNYSQYIHAHRICDLAIARQILAEQWPTYLAAFDKIMKRTSGHRFNMLVMRKDLLNAYCHWLFSVLFELENRLSTYTNNERVLGFVGERLLDVWLEANEIAYVELPVVFTEKQNWLKKGGNFLKRKFFYFRRSQDRKK